MTDEPVAIATDLHKSFGPNPALNGACLTVEPHGQVAVTGASGSGKSTLLLCLAGVLAPDSGSVRVLGRDLAGMRPDDRTRLRRRQIGLVLQFGQLVADLTAVENVALPLLLEGVPRREAEAQSLTWLERLGVLGVFEQRPTELSGGQSQRVAIARALVTGPTLILADEPTGALDSTTAEATIDLLVRTARETSAALVVVTHDNRVAAALDREVVLRDGVATGVEEWS